jgi:hypothetical protein
MGQVTINTDFGNYIYRTCLSNTGIRTVVDIGTWDGRGTTECVIRGLKDSGREGLSMISLETDKAFYDIAVASWSLAGLPEWANLVHGRLVDAEDLDRSNLTGSEPDWMAHDLKWFSECPKVVDMLPKHIDLAVLDGGEFSTKAEFLLLEPRTDMFILDDTATRKCRWIREHVLSNPSKYKVLLDNPNDRNGTMAFVVNRS